MQSLLAIPGVRATQGRISTDCYFNSYIPHHQSTQRPCSFLMSVMYNLSSCPWSSWSFRFLSCNLLSYNHLWWFFCCLEQCWNLKIPPQMAAFCCQVKANVALSLSASNCKWLFLLFLGPCLLMLTSISFLGNGFLLAQKKHYFFILKLMQKFLWPYETKRPIFALT